MSKLLQRSADLVLAALLAAALIGVYGWERNQTSRSEPGLTVVVEDTVQVDERAPSPLRLAVTPASFDDMGRLLDTLGEGYAYDVVEDADLEDPAVYGRYDVLFLTCAEMHARPQDRLATALRQFVSQGGTLYASDLRFDLLVAAFPEFVDATAVAQGTEQDVIAEVLEPGLQAILGTELPLHFDLDGWRPAAFGGRDVTVYLRGEFQTTAGVRIEAPLLVKFPVGGGAVFFTSFHNEKQNNDAEIELLKYLVFRMVTAKIESRVTRTMLSGGFSPQQQNLLSVTAGHPTVTGTYEHRRAGDLQFVLGFERQGARLRLEVQSPDGTSFVQQGDATLTIGVPAAPTGTWQYTAIAEKLPYPNFPFTLTVGAVSTELVAEKEGTAGATGAPLEPQYPPGAAAGTVTFREIELQPAAPAKKWRIGVSPPQFDNMGKLLDALGEGYRYENLPMSAFLDEAKLAQFDVIFLTCAGGDAGTPPLRQNLRHFVAGGGTLYASDLRYPMIAAAFPEFVEPDAEELRAGRAKQLADARQQLERLMDQQLAPPLADAVRGAGASPPLADRVDQVVAALQQAGLADKPRPAKTTLVQVLSQAGIPPLPEADIETLAKAIHDRALKINRAKREALKDAKALEQIQILKRQIASLEGELVAGTGISAKPLGLSQTVMADVVDPGLRELLGPTMSLDFNAGGWYPAYFAGKDVTVYLRGEFQRGLMGTAEAPLLISFPCGQGLVIYTAFHNEAQNSEQEQKLLRYLVFTAVTAKEEALVAKTMTSGGFSPAKRSLMGHTAGDPTVTQVYRTERHGRLQFALTFASQDARLRFTLLAPTGQKFEKEVTSTLVVEVPDAPAGAWQYTVTALKIPYENFPFSINIGEEP
jgi:hypothetical protein